MQSEVKKEERERESKQAINLYLIKLFSDCKGNCRLQNEISGVSIFLGT